MFYCGKPGLEYIRNNHNEKMQITSCVGICGMLEVCYRSNIVFMVMADSDIYIVLAKQLVRVTF